MAELSKNEEILLLSVWRLKDNAYGVAIKDHIKKITKKDWNYGTLYCTLDQLVKKGMLDKKEGEPIAERGGRRKIYYTLSPEGIHSLQAALELKKVLWEGITSIQLSDGNLS